MKKLIVLLVVAALCTPALAGWIDGTNPLLVDLGGQGVNPNKAGWQSWVFAQPWVGPVVATFSNPKGAVYQQPIGQLECFDKPQANQLQGLSRSREGGFAAVGTTGDYSAGTQGYGMNYLKLTLSQLNPDTEYKIRLWDWETSGTWSMSSLNPDSKFVAWSQANPKSWLDANYNAQPGEPPNGGYGPKWSSTGNSSPTTDSNMPAGLLSQVLARTDLAAFNSLSQAWDLLGGDACKSTIKVTSDDDGNIVLYAWMDATDWAGSAHVPLEGFTVMPEPTTIGLLGLGALALIRRKRA